MPEAAAVPAKPIKWPEPILLANNEAPTWEHKKCFTFMMFCVKAQNWY